MYKEINLYDNTKSEKTILAEAFLAIENNIDTIFTSSYYSGKLRKTIPDFIKIAVPIDYPNGLGHTGVRQHEVLTAINRGASIVDIVINPLHIINGQKSKLEDDIIAIKEICKLRKTELRTIMDYRMFTDGALFSICSTIQSLGIKYISPSTGQFVDDYIDNIIICELIQSRNPRLNAIFNASFCSKEQMEKILQSNIDTVRLKKFGV